MIPKIIHYTWFSNDKMPSNTIECINTWKQFMPDYELRLWDMKALQEIDSEYLQEALEAKKWACAADLVRLYAVYHYGGIYMDTDVKVFKSFDPLLHHRVFIGKETSIHIDWERAQYLSAHCFGAEKGHPYIKNCLDYFKDIHFKISKIESFPVRMKYNMVFLPYIQSEMAKPYGYDNRPLEQYIQQCKEGIVIYPSRYFDPGKITTESYCKHLALGSWRGNEKGKRGKPAGRLEAFLVFGVLDRFLARHTKYRIFQIQ